MPAWTYQATPCGFAHARRSPRRYGCALRLADGALACLFGRARSPLTL